MKFIISQNGRMCIPINNIRAITIERSNDNRYKLYIFNMPLPDYNDQYAFGVFKTEDKAKSALNTIFAMLESENCVKVIDDTESGVEEK